MNLRKINPLWTFLIGFIIAPIASALHSMFGYKAYMSFILPHLSIGSRGLASYAFLITYIPFLALQSLRYMVPLTVLTWGLLVAWNQGKYSLAKCVAGIAGAGLVAYTTHISFSSQPTALLNKPPLLLLYGFLIFTAPRVCWAFLLIGVALFARTPKALHG